MHNSMMDVNLQDVNLRDNEWFTGEITKCYPAVIIELFISAFKFLGYKKYHSSLF